MNLKYTYFDKSFLLLILLFLSVTGYTQSASVLVRISNMVQTTPNTFEYEIFLTNTGTSTIALRGYTWGINLTPGFENGGTVTHSFINRDPAFSNLPIVSSNYTASFYHARGSTTNAVAGLEVGLDPNIAYKLARMSIHTTAPCWLPNFNPFTPTSPIEPIQVTIAAGKTQCVMNAIVTPPGISYAINGITNPSAVGTIQGLTAVMNPDPFGSSPFLLNCACTTYDTIAPKVCNSYTWSANGQTYTASGTYSNTIVTPGACDSVSILNLTVALNPTNTLNGTTITSNATGVSYQWMNCGNNATIIGATNQTFTPSINGNYAVIISNGSCVDTSACVTVSTVGLHEIAKPESVQIYPNPGPGIFTIALNETSTIIISNANGEVVFNETLIQGKHNINLSNKAKGIYVAKIMTTSGYYTIKLTYTN